MSSKQPQLILTLLCTLFLLTNCGVSEDKGEAQVELLEAGKEYKIRLGRKEEKVIRFDAQGFKYYFNVDITSSSPFEFCILAESGECSTQLATYSKRQTGMTFKPEQVKWGAKVRNPSVQVKLKLQLRYHDDKEDCHLLSIRELHLKELHHSTCFMFQIQKEEDLSLLIGKETFMDIDFTFNLCQVNLQLDEENNEFLFPATKIHQACIGKTQKILLVSVIDREYSGQKTTEENEGCNLQLSLLLQSSSGPIILPEGIAYRSSKGIEEGSNKVFQFELINKRNTSINVITEAQIQIYAKVVEEKDKDTIVPNSNDHDFSSKSGQLFTYFRPYMLITDSQLQQTQCEDCWLIVSVVLEGEGKSLSIQITQELSVLTNGEMKHQFLEGGSMAYYSYFPKIDATVYYELSDNNQGCAQFYLGLTMLPSALNSLQHSYHGKIMYKSKANQVYYIGVEATSDCPYSITVTDSSNELVLLEKGRFGYLNLGKDETKYFLIRAESSQYLKLLSLHLYGKVEIYLNKTDSKGIQKFDSSLTHPTDFSMKGQFMNRLVLDHQQKLFCDGCYYIVAVVAEKVTESTLFYGDEDTPIPIRDKVINDIILREGETVKGEYYGDSKFNLLVKIHSGKLKVTISNQKNTFQREYSDEEIVKTTLVDLGKKKGIISFIASLFDADPISAKFQALEDNTVYSVRFQENQQEQTEEIEEDTENSQPSSKKEDSSQPQSQQKQDEEEQEQEQEKEKVKTKTSQSVNIEAGVSETFDIEVDKEVCLSGFFKDRSEKLLLSCEPEERQQLNDLFFNISSNGKDLQYETDILRNIMTITVPALSQYHIQAGVPYTICFNSPNEEPVRLSLMQTQDFALLPPQVDSIVKGQYTFVSHAQTPLIVDIFECKGHSSLIYGKERQQLLGNASHSLDVIGLKDQPHAVRVNQFGTTFYKISAPLAIVRWFPFLIEEGVGTGYLDFAIGKLAYQSGVFGISLNWGSLVQERDTNSTIEKVMFTLYVSTNTDDLKAASHCQSFLELDTWRVPVDINPQESIQIDKQYSFTLSKGQLVDRFGENTTLFCTIVADVTVKPWQGEQSFELYRFIYPDVEIPGEIVNKGYLNAMTLPQLIMLGVGAILCLVTIFYCVLRKILPLLGILKNRYLIEEEGPEAPDNKVSSEAHPDDLIVPPSSERQGSQKFDAMIQQLEVEEEQK